MPSPGTPASAGNSARWSWRRQVVPCCRCSSLQHRRWPAGLLLLRLLPTRNSKAGLRQRLRTAAVSSSPAARENGPTRASPSDHALFARQQRARPARIQQPHHPRRLLLARRHPVFARKRKSGVATTAPRQTSPQCESCCFFFDAVRESCCNVATPMVLESRDSNIAILQYQGIATFEFCNTMVLEDGVLEYSSTSMVQ